jgi:putative ABC transport system substrate-binding protein
MIGRREFITLLGGVAVAVPFAVRAQQVAGRVARIAFLLSQSQESLDPLQLEQFKAGLAENGLIEGQNISVDYLWAEGNPERMRELATELAGRDLDVIVTAGPQLVRAVIATGTKTPIVFAVLGDPIGDGFVQSLAHPGGNITGLSMSDADLESKRLEILKDAFPAVGKVMILRDPSVGPQGLSAVQAVAQVLGLQSVVFDAADPAKFADIFRAAAAQGVNGLTAMASPFLYFQRKQLTALAAEHRLPSIWESSAYVRDGGLLSYGPSFADMYRRSAGYVAKVLGGRKPADLPVEQPTKFELIINMKTAKALGLNISPALLARADEVIE